MQKVENKIRNPMIINSIEFIYMGWVQVTLGVTLSNVTLLNIF